MAKRARATGRLVAVQQELARWRKQHGGRGRSIPSGLWAAAAEVAAVEGVNVTASALDLSRARLARHLRERSSTPAAASAPKTPTFVEVETPRMFASRRSLVRLRRASGEQLEIEVEGGSVEVASLARSLWDCTR